MRARFLGRAAATAAALIAEAQATAAAALAAAFKAITASLERFAAQCVAARAGDAAAVFRAFAIALAPCGAQIEVANLDSVSCATARGIVVTQGTAEVLEIEALALFVAAAVNLEAAFALLEP